MTITRTTEISDITPEELAHEFTEMDSLAQAAFFARVWRIAREWPGAGWCGQSMGIAQHLDRDGRDCIAKLAEWAADPEGLNA